MLAEPDLATIQAAKEILARHFKTHPILTSYTSLTDYCTLSIPPSEVEESHALYLDKKNRLIEDHNFGQGTVDHVPVYPREVLKRALIVNASAMILVHNHPSGDPTPSQSDISLTKLLIKGAKAIGLTVHDHIIVGDAGKTYSLKSHGDI